MDQKKIHLADIVQQGLACLYVEPYVRAQVTTYQRRPLILEKVVHRGLHEDSCLSDFESYWSPFRHRVGELFLIFFLV